MVINGNISEEKKISKGLKNTLLVFRIALGFDMLYMAYILFTGGWDAFANASAMIPGVVQGPFGDIMLSMYGNPIPIYLLALGAAFVGVTFVTGFLVRLGAYSGILIGISFYLAGLPPTNGWINIQVIYILSFMLVAFSRTGYQFGIDKYLYSLEENYPVIRYITG